MTAKRRSRRRSSEDSEELGLERAKKPAQTAPLPPEDEGSDDEEESGKPSDARPVRHAPANAAPKPKGTPDLAKKPSPLPTEDAGAQGSVEASPARGAPSDGRDAAAPPPRKKSKTKKTKKRAKRRLPPSQEEDEVDESGDPSLVSKAPADETTAVSPRRDIAAAPRLKSGAAPARKRAKRGATPKQAEEEQAEKRAAGADGDNVNQKTEKNKKLQKVLAEVPQPDSAGLELTGNREDVPDACNISCPREKDNAQEEEQQGEMVEQGHAGNTSPPQMEDGAEEEEQEIEEVAEHAENTSLPQLKDGAHEDGDMGVEVSVEALLERNTSSPKISTSEGDKKLAVERSWSQDDELKILRALVEHAKSHEGALPYSSDLVDNLTFDKTDANAGNLNDKIRKLRARYRRLCLKGHPTDDIGRRLFDLSAVLWGQGDNDVQVDTTFVSGDRDFTQLSSLYPYLAEEVKVYAEKHSSGNLILAAFPTIGDATARQLDAMCKKQRHDTFNLELSQANLTKALLSAVSSQIN
ncbi:hypothetical protein HU200_066128 [Digitaria exilis]|uniref:Glabrous enhancer-binding protein-like DBD domain-containing protein n=1 Tax=Digitaria exilis TaxID=1010633 RepID=A0A834ZX29_9POAL|nr:hypothetical protein HU200_066128 [Digitaria exilis]CAB3486312.1 unnamed protein product [Digitaria exilis]